MKRLLLLTLALVTGFAASASAARTIRVVAPYRAPQFEGAVVAVRGRAEIRQDSNLQGTEVRLVGADGRIQFVGIISKLNQHAFPDMLALNGREVVMYGVIEMYFATPATQLTYRDQLRSWPPVARS